METTTQHFTAQDWAEHAQFVRMFRAAKQRKREWQVLQGMSTEFKKLFVSLHSF